MFHCSMLQTGLLIFVYEPDVGLSIVILKHLHDFSLVRALYKHVYEMCRRWEKELCWREKRVRGREKEILGVCQSVSFAYISLVPWNAILSPRQQVESSRQTQASLLGVTGWGGAGRPWITLHNNVIDRPSTEGISEREVIKQLSPPTATPKDTLNWKLKVWLVWGWDPGHLESFNCQRQVFTTVVLPVDQKGFSKEGISRCNAFDCSGLFVF